MNWDILLSFLGGGVAGTWGAAWLTNFHSTRQERRKELKVIFIDVEPLIRNATYLKRLALGRPLEDPQNPNGAAGDATAKLRDEYSKRSALLDHDLFSGLEEFCKVLYSTQPEPLGSEEDGTKDVMRFMFRKDKKIAAIEHAQLEILNQFRKRLGVKTSSPGLDSLLPGCMRLK